MFGVVLTLTLALLRQNFAVFLGHGEIEIAVELLYRRRGIRSEIAVVDDRGFRIRVRIKRLDRMQIRIEMVYKG